MMANTILVSLAKRIAGKCLLKRPCASPKIADPPGKAMRKSEGVADRPPMPKGGEPTHYLGSVIYVMPASGQWRMYLVKGGKMISSCRGADGSKKAGT